MKARWKDPEYAQTKSETARVQAWRPEVKKAFAEMSRERWADPEVRSKYAALWSDPTFKSKCMTGLKARNEREAAKTHCKNGHEYTPENTHVTKKGRECRTCRNAGERVRRAAKRRLTCPSLPTPRPLLQ